MFLKFKINSVKAEVLQVLMVPTWRAHWGPSAPLRSLWQIAFSWRDAGSRDSGGMEGEPAAHMLWFYDEELMKLNQIHKDMHLHERDLTSFTRLPKKKGRISIYSTFLS